MDPFKQENESDPVAEAASLPLSDRIVHKHWKVREDAYEKLAEKFDVAEEDAKIYSDFFSSLGKIVRDANAPAQLKGFDALCNYADAAPPQLVRRATADVVKGIVEKGLAGRPANKNRAIETFAMFVGADAGDVAVDVIVTVGFKHKTPKVVVAAVEAVTKALEDYGSIAVPLKPVAVKLPPLLNHAQESVRNVAKALLILMQRWVGSKAVEPVLKDAKEVIKKEMETIFEKNNKLGKLKPKKRTRAMEQRARNRGVAEVVDEDDGFGEAGVEEEEVDLSEEINLLERLAKEKIQIDPDTVKDWFTAIDSKRWNARKDALDVAVKILDGVRLIPVSYQEIFSRLRKIIPKDPNVNVVASAAKLVGAMACGLKKNFPPGMAKAIMLDLFSRLKEKNPVVVHPVCAALDELHQKRCIRFFEHFDEIKSAAEHKVPKARCELHLWLGRCLLNGTAGIDLKGTPLKVLGALFLKASDDSSPDVRDAALANLAALQKLVGERNVKAYLEKLDKKRKDKVASILESLPEPSKVPPSAASSGPAANTRLKAAQQRASASPSSTPSTTKGNKLLKAPVRKTKKKKKPAAQVLVSDDEGEITHSSEDAFAAAADRFEGFEADNWSVKSFKARAAAVESVLAGLRDKDSLTPDDISVVLGLLSTPPGLSDNNFMALKPKLELFELVATKCSAPLPRKTLKPLLAVTMDKLGDIKAAKITASILMSYAEATSPRYFTEILTECVKETKNSRALIGMLKMATSVVEDFGIPPVPEKSIAAIAGPNLTNPASAAKNGAIALACKAAVRAGPDRFRGVLETEGCEQEGLEVFDGELEKYNREPDPPSRKRKFDLPPAPADSEDDDDDEQEESQHIAKEERRNSEATDPANEPKSTIDSSSTLSKRIYPKLGEPKRGTKPLPSTSSLSSAEPEPTAGTVDEEPSNGSISQPAERISVAHEFASGARIFLELKNANWKKRQDALGSVEAILNNAHNFIKPNVGNDIINALRARLSDSNRNLAAVAFDVVEKFVRAMGPGGNIHLKTWAPGIFGQGLIENKPNVRDGAYRCLDACYEVYGLSALIPYCPLPLASKTSSVRKSFLEWLVPRLTGSIGEFDPSNEDLNPLIEPCLNCLRDRYTEVRTLADHFLEPIVKSVGIVTIDNKVSVLSRAARLQVEPTVEKYRNESTENTAVPPPIPNKTPLTTPRAVRERPKSVAIPRTPVTRKPSGTEEDEATPFTSARRQRPASARVTPVVASSIAAAGHGVDDGPMFKPNTGKEARAQRYTNKRVQLMDQLRATDPTCQIPPLIGEEIADIAADLKECCSPKLYAKLTAPANRFKMHVDAIEMVATELEDNPDSFSSVCDILFRWAACRIEDGKTPPTVLIKLAGFVSLMCEVLMSSGVKLSDYEASTILPPIVEKVGSNREAVCSAMQSAILSVNDIVENDILLILYTSCFRKPMSVRSHSEISKEICRLIEERCTTGMGVPRGVLPAIGKIAGGNDDGAGRAAAACLERAHEFFGDDLWALVGELTNEEASLLDDRLTSVINGMKHGMGAPIAGEYEGTAENDQSATESETLFAGQQQSSAPGDIRNEDFRLSVAPAPPSSVLTSISDSINATTPIRTREEIGYDAMPETPALPKLQPKPDLAPDVEAIGIEILNRLHSPDRDVQLSGLASIFDNMIHGATLLQFDIGTRILLRLVQCFESTLGRLEGGNPLEDDAAVLKSFLKGIIRFSRVQELLRRLDQTSLEYLLSDALNAMIPQKVAGVADWDQVRRGVNLMIVKVLESCDQNLLFTALINLLLANIRTMQRSAIDKMPALAKSSICIKSIAKVAKRGFKDCRVNALLRDIHVFLKANPVRRDGSASSEDQTFAMRLLKTVVDAVIKEIGTDVLNRLDLIAQPDKSQLVQYVEMTLKEGGHDISERSDKSSQDSTTKPGSTESPVGVLQNELNGNNLLIDAGKSDVSKVTPEKRLQGGAKEDIKETVGRPVESETPAHSAGQVYLRRLHDIQRKYGLHSKASAEAIALEKENGNASRQASAEEATRKASSLRERMARIRELQSASKE